MLRFRTIADENLYLALRTELYVAAAQLGDPQLTTVIMRNFGKLEALVHSEGVRQGLAVAALSKAGLNLEAKTPSSALATAYGDAATPLARVERHWIRREDGSDVPDEELPVWLDASEARFPAMTYAEAMGIAPPPPPMYKVDAPNAPVPVVKDAPRPVPPTDTELASLFEDDGASVTASPEQLDHYRTELVVMKKAGVTVQSWPELVLALGLRLQEDPGFVDLALGTESGLLIVSQAGYDVRPGSAASMDSFLGGHEIAGHTIDLLPPKPPSTEPADGPPDLIE